jgi:hypothetical protein
MQFKLHPLYDQAPLRDWISIGPLTESISPTGGQFQNLLVIASSNLERFTSYALEQIQKHVGPPYLAERPYPEINSVLFRPTSPSGFQIYVEYFFLQEPDENSPDSDVWWAIINCPSATQANLQATLHFNVTDLGWSVI